MTAALHRVADRCICFTNTVGNQLETDGSWSHYWHSPNPWEQQIPTGGWNLYKSQVQSYSRLRGLCSEHGGNNWIVSHMCWLLKIWLPSAHCITVVTLQIISAVEQLFKEFVYFTERREVWFLQSVTLVLAKVSSSSHCESPLTNWRSLTITCPPKTLLLLAPYLSTLTNDNKLYTRLLSTIAKQDTFCNYICLILFCQICSCSPNFIFKSLSATIHISLKGLNHLSPVLLQSLCTTVSQKRVTL